MPRIATPLTGWSPATQGCFGSAVACCTTSASSASTNVQAISQLIDTLVLRGYLERHADAADRRRLTVELTERGRAAAAAVREGVLSVDDELLKRVSPADLDGLRAALFALIQIGDEAEA